MMPGPRFPLAVSSASRDYLRDKGSWGVNGFTEIGRMIKRPGYSLHTSGSSPGQGIFNYSGSVVRVNNDVLWVGGSSWAL